MMKFEISREWLIEKLAHCDDASVGAGGTPIEHLPSHHVAEQARKAGAKSLLAEYATVHAAGGEMAYPHEAARLLGVLA